MSSDNNSLSSLIEQISNSIDNDNLQVDYDSLSLEDQEKKAKIDRIKQDTNDRRWLAQWASSLVSLWLFAVIILLSCNNHRFTFNLVGHNVDIMPAINDNVLIALLATTTLNVLGLTVIVLRGHFKINDSEINSNNS